MSVVLDEINKKNYHTFTGRKKSFREIADDLSIAEIL